MSSNERFAAEYRAKLCKPEDAVGPTEPGEFRNLVAGLPEDRQRWILRENGFSLVQG